MQTKQLYVAVTALENWPRCYKTIFKLNWIEHEIYPANTS